MADEEHDPEGRSEAASARKLQRSWDEGQVPVGHDAAPAVGLLAAAAALTGLAASLRSGLHGLFAETLRALPQAPFESLPALAARPALTAAALCAVPAAAALAITLAQTKGGFWPHLALPDLGRLFQPARLTRLAKREFLVDLGLATVKVVAIGATAWIAVRGDFMTLPRLLGSNPSEQLAAAFGILARAGVRVLAIAAVLAGVELAITRFRFAARMRMTKEEARREFKEEEGDPMLRGRRRRRHRELAKNRARIEIPRADALLVNPTHVAVALRYRRDEGRAPRVTAKGKGVLAEYMRELARENGIPIVQDVPLARLLYRKVKVGGEIPAQTYKAVAAVLAFVYRMTRLGSQSEVKP